VSIVCSKSQWVLKGSAPVAPNNDNPNNHLQLFALPFSPTVVPGVVVPAPGFSSLATGSIVSFTADLIAPNTGSTWGELGFRNVPI
jgi:hypothetical protein